MTIEHGSGSSRRGFLLEPLEPRVLLSADSILSEVYRALQDDEARGPGRDFAAIVQEIDAATSTQISAAVRGAFEPAPTVDWPATWRAPASDVLYVVDGSVAENLRDIDSEVLVLDQQRDGVEQIGEALAGRSDIAALHIVSHGASGSVTLGSTRLNAENLGDYGSQLQAWADALTAEADILFYGCELAASSAGATFVLEMSRLIGADIAASTDLSGSAALGGDWELEYATGSIDAAAFASDASLLLSALPFAEFFDPNPAPGNQFGATVVELSTGNVVITSPGDDAGGTDAGAVYLFNGQTGALISALTGSSANDGVGASGITLLSDGNFLVHSVNWDNGAASNAGAVTFVSGLTGVSGPVSAANSLVGSSSGDQIGNGGITLLSSGNYLVRSASWDNGAAVNAGAVTFFSGTTGVRGTVSAANSLVGTTADDAVGSSGITLLSNGNYLVRSTSWDNGAAVDAGAVTFASGTTGVRGVVSEANSLVGSTTNDAVGSGGITQLSTGNYVITSSSWDNGATANAGAVTFGSGTTGVSGVVSAANSLVGGTAGDLVGSVGAAVPTTRITLLGTGNYLVHSTNWHNGAASLAGAVTFGSGTTGVSGVVSAANSLVGTTPGDQVGNSSIPLLSNGNYLVHIPNWDNGAVVDAGAVTFGSGTTGISGAVSAANSLVGSSASDRVGIDGFVALSNGNYLVRTLGWDNGAAGNAGAVSFGSGTTGVSGVVGAANSLIGTTSGDQIGSSGITVLGNDNYLVRSPGWDNVGAANAGAVTFGSGTEGVTGVVGAANSLVGITTNDQVGNAAITLLSTGNYVVRSSNWDNGAAVDAGAVTFGSGTAGVSGAVSAANSLVGSTGSDQVGGITPLSNGNYLVNSPLWNNGAIADAGAVTFGSGTAGVSGVVSAANSLVGSTANDQVGSGGITLLSTGNYVVRSANWDNGAALNAGAVTFGNGTTGVIGEVSAANSLVGTSASDQVGNGAITLLSTGNYVVTSTSWNNAGAIAAGAVTFGSGTTGVSGVVSTANSLVGGTANDAVGNTGITLLSNGNYLVRSAGWDNGAAANAGAVTFGSGATGVSGVVSAANSLVGSALEDRVGSLNTSDTTGITLLSNGNFVVRSLLWNNGVATDAGAVTFGSGTTGVNGVVSAANSLVGGTANDQVGIGGITELSTGNYMVTSYFWRNPQAPGASGAGAVTFGSGTTGVKGLVSAANSLVGSSFGDQVGRGGIIVLSTGNYLVRSPFWHNQGQVDAGAVTFGSGTTGVSGVVSAANSLLGSRLSDRVGDAITVLSNGNYVVSSSSWDNGFAAANAGAVTFGSGMTGVSGFVSAANSLVGTTANDQVGNGGITLLSTGNYVVRSVSWDNGAAVDAGALTFGSATTGVSGAINSGNSAIGLTSATSLQAVGVGNVNGIFYGRFLTEGGGRVRVGSQGDGFPNTVNLSVSAAAGSEAGTTAITVTATAEKTVFGNQTVGLGVSGVSITAGDYTLSSSAITILDGQTTGSVTFTVADDTLLELTETATLSISSLSAGLRPGATTTHDVVISDNESATLAIAPTSLVTEAGSAQTVGVVTLAITGTGSGTFALGSGISVTADVTDAGGGTALAGLDYSFGTQTVIFDQGALSGATRGVLLTALVDGVLEEDETVHLSLGNLGGSAVAKSLGNTSNVTTITSGSVFVEDGHLFVIDIIAAADGNADLVITSDTANSRYVIAETNPAKVLLAGTGATQIDATTVYVPFSAVTGDIRVDTLGGDDSLTVDFSLGNFSRTIAYDGGAQSSTSGDSLSLAGGNFDTGTFAFTNDSDGTIDLAGNSPISYVGLEPIVATVLIDNVILAFDGGTETITLADAAGAAMTIDSTLGESLTFFNPASSLTIDAGTGDDQVAIASVDAAFGAALTINGGEGHDTINLNADVTFPAAKNLHVDADTINVGPNANIVLAGAGTATLQATGNIALASGSSVTTVDGAIALSANRQATPTAGNFAGVTVNAGAMVAALGSGQVTVSGTGGSSAGHENFGVQVTGANAQITANGGSVLVEGTGGGAGTSSNNHGVHVTNGGVITNAGLGAEATVTVRGTGGNGTGSGSSNHGVLVTGPGSKITANGAAVLVEGTGGGTGTSGDNRGVHVTDGGLITNAGPGAAATVTVTGTGGSDSTGSRNYGVLVSGTGSQITANGAAVLVEGTGGGAGTSGNNHGVRVIDGGVITNAAPGAGATVTVRGTGGNGGGSENYGVLVAGVAVPIGGVLIPGLNEAVGTITANGGAVLVEGTGGGGGASGFNIGVAALDAGVITNMGTDAGSTVTVRGTGGNSGGSNNYGVLVDNREVQVTDGKIRANGGALLVEGFGGGAGASSNNHGVVVNGDITNTGTGMGATLTVRGTGGHGAGDNNRGVVANSQITAHGGAMLLEGTGGGAETSGGNFGVTVLSFITNSGTGTGATVTIRGTGGNGGGDNNSGVGMLGFIQTLSGAVLIEGFGGGAGMSSNNLGVVVSEREIRSAEATVTVRGTGGSSGGDNNHGVVINRSEMQGVAVVLEGSGGGAGTSGSNHGVVISGRFAVNEWTGAGAGLTVRGTGGSSGGDDNSGVVVTGLIVTSKAHVDSNGFITHSNATPSGAVLLEGTGGGAGTSSNNHGVVVSDSGFSESATGTGIAVTVRGTGGNRAGTGGSNNHGVLVSGAGAQITASARAVLVEGTGGGTADSIENHGVFVLDGGAIANAGTGLGATVTVKGSGGSSADHDNFGVHVLGAGARITANGGALLVEGTGGGSETTSGNNGVVVRSGGVIANEGTGAGATVSVKGIADDGAAGDVGNIGVWVVDMGSQITANGGAVFVEGTGGGTGTSSNNYGVYVDAGGAITNTGTGPAATVVVSGTGGNAAGSGNANYGVWIFGTGAQIRSSGGAITVVGTSGSGAASSAILVSGEGQVIGTAGNTVMTLIGDSMDFQSGLSINAGSNTVILRPRTAGTLIDLGGADVLLGSPLTLGLTDAELDRVSAGVLRIGSANAGAITVTSAIDLADAPTIPTLHLITGAAIVDANAIGNDLTVSNLALQAAGGVGSSDALDTQVDALAAVSGGVGAGAGIQIIDASEVSVAEVDGVVGIFSSSADVNLRTDSSLTLDQSVNAGSGDVRVVAGTTVTQSAAGVITADELGILAGANVRLANASNDVNTLAAGTTALIEFRDSDDLAIGVVPSGGNAGFTGAGGIASHGGNVNLRTGTSLTFNQSLNAEGGDARLVVGTTVMQAASGPIRSDELGILAGASLLLAVANNDVNTLAVNTTGLVEFRDNDDLALGSVAADFTIGFMVGFTGVNGITSNNSDVNLRSGSLSVNRVLNAGTGDIRVVADTGVTQSTNGVVTADELGILTRAGRLTLAAAASDVNSLAVEGTAAFATVDVEFRDSDDLAIGALAAGGSTGFTGAVGIASKGGDISLKSEGDLVVNQRLDAGFGDVRVVSHSAVTQAADGVINAFALGINATGSVTLAAANNDVARLAATAGGLTEFRDGDDLRIALVLAETVNNIGFTPLEDIISGGGDINLYTGTSLTFNGALNAGAGDVRIVAGTAIVGGGGITADELGIRAGGDALLGFSHHVSSLAVSTTGLVELHNESGLTVSTVAAGGNAGFTGVAGIASHGGDVNLRIGGSLTLNQPLDAGAGDVRLVADTAVTQAAGGAIRSDELGIVAGAGVLLGLASNDINTFAVAAAGPVEFNDADDLTIGPVAAGGNFGFAGAAGLDSGTHAMSLTAPGGVFFTSAAVLEVDLGGPASHPFTRVSISHQVTLGGTLQVDANGFEPAANLEFMLFDARIGEFAIEDLPANFELEYGAKTLTLVFDANDAPDAQDDSATTAEDTPIAIPVLANDSDADPVARTVLVADFQDFLGAGFAPEPAAGQLDSDSWRAGGFSDTPLLAFGGTVLLGDLARGFASGAVGTGGVYAFTGVGSAGNTILGVQPAADDFTPGFIDLRLQNNTGAAVATMDLSYEIWAYNDEARANSLSFSYSLDGITFISVGALDFVTAGTADLIPAWQPTLRSLATVAVNLDPGEEIILRWTGDDVSGSGGRDQYGIDNVTVGFTSVNDGLAVSAVTQGSNGSVIANADGSVTYAPNTNFYGSDSFTYTASDGVGGFDTATVRVTVTPVNDAPVAQNDSASTAEDDPVIIAVLANDSDVESEAGAPFIEDFDDFLGTGFAAEPGAGQLDSDIWRVGGFTDALDLARGVAAGPVVTGGIYAFTGVGTAGNTILGVQPSGSDFNPGFIDLRLKNESGAIVSSIDLSYEIWSYNDAPRANSLNFSYSLDGITFTSVAALDFVTAEAFDTAPVAWQQTLRALTGLAVDLAPGEEVILRWSGADVSGSGTRDEYGIDNVIVEFIAAETLTVAAVTQGANGSVGINADGTVRYAPNLNFHGTDSFTYTVSDGAGGFDTATVTVTVASVNDAPLALDDSASTAEDTPVTIAVAANDSDVDPVAPTVFLADFAGFLGTGFAPVPAPGQLDADVWHASGFSDAADLARGASSMPVVTGGIYAFTDVGTAGNTILGVQPSSDDFTPGFIDLRVQNNTGALVESLDLSYEIWTYNDQDRANSLHFSYSLDGITFTSVAALEFVTPEAADAGPMWQRTLRSLTGLAVDLAAGHEVILRWSGDDVSGGGGRDEYGLDNVSIGFLTENDGLTVSGVTQGANGSVSINADGTVTYAPNLNFHGIDSFTYTVSDGELTDTASVTVTVTPVNDAPVAADDSASTAEDTPVSIPVLANDSDVDPVASTVFLADFDGFLGAGFAPEPAPGQLDSDLWSAGGFSDAADLARGASPTPVVSGGIYAFTDVGTAGNTILGVQPSADDFTPGFIELRLANDRGEMVAFVDLSYEIWAYNDQDRANSLNFSYSLDGSSFVSVAALDFVSPEARDTAVVWQQSLRSLAGLAVNLDPGEEIILRWSGDDASGSGVRDQYGIDNVRVGFAAANEGLAVTAVTQGTNGIVSINADGSVRYAPNLNFHGTDSFAYTVSDGVLTDTANVTVTVTPVNDAPVAVDDSASTAEDTPVAIAVLANDSDVDPQAHAVFVAGFDDFLGTGFAPEPAAGQLDSDFWHAGGFSDAADLARGASSMPVVTGGIYAFTDVGTAGNTILGMQPAADDFTPGFVELRLVNDTDAVIATIDLSYEIWTYNDAARANSLNFSYSLDGISFTSIAGLDLVTTEAADAVPAWQQTQRSLAALAVNVDPGEEIILRWTGDDVSGSGGRDQYGIDNVAVGFAATNEGLAVTAVTQGSNGSVTANGDGTVTYMPNANFHGTDSFSYTVRDDAGALDTASVTVTVTPVNDAPVAQGDAFVTDEDTPLVVAAPGVLGNDTDVDLDSLSAALVTGPAHGVLVLNADGSFTYTPDAGFSGSDSFTYKAVDGSGGESAVATVSLTVRSVNDAPEVDGGEDQLVGLQKKSLGYATITLEGLFTDADLGDTHTASIDWGDGSEPTAGTVDQAAGSITGEHSYQEVGEYVVTVTVRDNNGAERSDTLTITVVDTAKNQVIRARSDRYQVVEGGTLQVAAPEGVLSNDEAAAGATVQARLVSGPQHGTLTFNADGSFSYTADAGFTGRDFFWYEINDETNVSRAVKVWLVVAPVAVAHLDWTGWVAYGKPSASFLAQVTWTQSLAEWLARLTSADS